MIEKTTFRFQHSFINSECLVKLYFLWSMLNLDSKSREELGHYNVTTLYGQKRTIEDTLRTSQGQKQDLQRVAMGVSTV